MPTPIIHTTGGALVYLLTGNLDINRWYIVTGVTVLSSLPDLDFLIPGPHRGFSHSLAFCILCSAVVGYLTKFSYLSVFSILVSHLLLDSLADGFYTVSWLWPFYSYSAETSYGWNNIIGMIKHALRVF